MSVIAPETIDTWYTRVFARHATVDEQSQWSALSQLLNRDTLAANVVDIPEAEQYVDPVLRLYAAAFHRTPDTLDPNADIDSGAQSGYWTNVNALRNGLTLVQLAEAFVGSPEFRVTHGTTELQAAVIIDMYQSILQRSPGSGEIAAWMNTGLDTAHVMLGITESTESKDLASWKAVEFEKFAATTAFNSEHSESNWFFEGLLPPSDFLSPSPRPGGAYDQSVQAVGVADNQAAHFA